MVMVKRERHRLGNEVRDEMINRAFNLEVLHRAEPLCGSKRMRAFNFEIASEPSLPVLAVASSRYRKQFCTAPETHSSFAPLERREIFSRSFRSINISPQMARRATRLCCTSKLNPPLLICHLRRSKF